MPRGELPPAPAPVAVCCLSSRELVAPLADLPGVALAGTLMTANLGIEEILGTLCRYPAVRALLVCGRDSPRFRAGQSLIALFEQGLADERGRIRGATGYLPVLRSLPPERIEEIRARVEVVDARGVRDIGVLRAAVDSLVARLRTAPGAPTAPGPDPAARERAGAFRAVRPVGRRSPLQDSIEGFVVITVDAARRRIRLRHYDRDLTPRHQMWGTRAESMLLGLLGAGIVGEPSHAGYLGGELTKAETALRLGLPYEQDLPLRAPASRARRRPKTAKERPGMDDGTHRENPDGFGELLRRVARTLDIEAATLDPHLPVGEQVAVDSARIIELTVVLEEELGLCLPDDIDLRQVSLAELHKALVS
ncbi:hypothetical protein ACFP1Z_04840 [Streptomyces gamaensis]|uniref:DUF4346 domain-containing protein n=1 Tax=Streptomyces gamaensis TaxID=1763542 RepID=A0ABW0YVQ8_9ACTN